MNRSKYCHRPFQTRFLRGKRGGSRNVFVVTHGCGWESRTVTCSNRNKNVTPPPPHRVCVLPFYPPTPTTLSWTFGSRPTLKSSGISYRDREMSSGGTHHPCVPSPETDCGQAQVRHATPVPGDPPRSSAWPLSGLQEPGHAQ